MAAPPPATEAQPFLDDKPPNPAVSTSPSHPPHRPNRKRIVFIGGPIAFGALALVAGVIVQIIVVHDSFIDSQNVVSTAPLGRTLAIIHACSSFVSITVPLLLGLEGYRIGRSWLEASRHNGLNRPTPTQLGLMMNVLSKGNITGFGLGVKTLLGFGPQRTQGKPLRRPTILRSAIITLLALLIMNWLCIGFEEWLGIASESVFIRQTAPWNGQEIFMSRVLNQTLCDSSPQAPGPTNGFNLCGLVGLGNIRSLAGVPEGVRTITNSSDRNAVQYTNDGIAILVPPPAQIPVNVTYRANTIGVQATCKSISDQCIDTDNPGPQANINWNCSASVNMNNTAMNAGNSVGGKFPFGIVDDNGTPLDDSPWLVASNPFRYAAVFNSFTYVTGNDADEHTFVGDTGFFIHGNQGAWNAVSCQLYVYEVTYSYFNGSYATHATTPSDMDTTRRVAALSDQISERLRLAVDGVGFNGGSYVDAFALEASREMAGLSSKIWQSGPTLSVARSVSTIGSKIPLAPLIALLLVLVIYTFTALTLMSLALRAVFGSPESALARTRISDPLTAVHAAYGPFEVSRTWKEDPNTIFGNETEDDRLNVGPIRMTDGDNVAYGVSRDPLDGGKIMDAPLD